MGNTINQKHKYRIAFLILEICKVSYAYFKLERERAAGNNHPITFK
jgi:hypothetical protein